MQRNERKTQTPTKAEEIQSWEGEGGATLPEPPKAPVDETVGNPSEIEQAKQIKRRVHAEFDRVAGVIRSRTQDRSEHSKVVTEVLIAILESKRWEITRREDASYFIHNWQEIGDQVWCMILSDERYRIVELWSRRLSNGRQGAEPRRRINCWQR
jgi:hypothetical protein